MNKYKCKMPNHQKDDIISVCLNKQCIQERVCCHKCEVENHNDHPKQFVDFYFMSYFFEIKRIHYDKKHLNYSNNEQKVGTLSIINKEEIFYQMFMNFPLHALQILKQMNDQIIIDAFDVINLRRYIKNICQIQRRQSNGLVNHYLPPFCYLIEKALLEEEYMIKIEQQNYDKQGEYQQCKDRLDDILQLIERDIQNIFENTLNNNQYLVVQRSPEKIQQQNISQIGISEDGTMVICGQQHSVKLLDVETYQQIWEIKFEERLQTVVLSSNNQYLAILTDLNSLEQMNFFGERMGIETISIYKVKYNLYRKFIFKNGSITNITFSDDCQFILTLGNYLKVWNLLQGKIIFNFKTGSLLKTIVSADNKYISYLTNDYGCIYIWNMQNRKSIVQRHHTDHYRKIDLCSSKDSQIYISRGVENIKIWKFIHSNNNENSSLILIKVIVDQHYGNQVQFGKILLTSDEQYIISINIFEIMIHEIESGKMIQLIPFIRDQFRFKNYNISKDLNAFVTLQNSNLFEDDHYIWRRI